MIKALKSALVALSLLLPSIALAEQVAISSFKYLNSNDNSVTLDPSDASDLLNVNISPSGKSVSKRQGYGLYKTAFSASSGVHGGYHSFDSFGNDVQLWASSVSVVAIVADGTPATVVSSMTVNSTLDCTDTQGSSYCVDSNRDFFLKITGNTLINWYTSPLGTMIESTPDRVVVAGNLASQNTLFVSQSNNFTNFTTGVNATDAFTEVIAAPGSHLTHIRWGCQKLLWWKDQSFGYFDFDDQYSAQVKIVSDIIGTFDNTSAIDPGGNVWFRGQDGHTWKYDCSSLSKQTIDITPQIQASGRRTTNMWLQSTGGDFNGGSGVSIDTSTTSGSVLLSGYTNNFDAGFSDGVNIRGTFSNATVSGNSYVYVSSAVGPGLIRGAMRGPAMPGFTPTNDWYVGSNVSVSIAANSAKGCIGLINVSTQGYHACIEYASGSFSLTLTNADYTSIYNSVSLGASDGTTHVLGLKYSPATGLLTGLWDGVSRVTSTQTGITGMVYPSIWGTPGASDFFAISDLGVKNSTGTYYSAVRNANSLISWGPFNPNIQTSDSNNQTFSMRSSTSSFTVRSSTPSWTTQTANTQITIATGTYFQVRDDFAVTSGTQTPTLNDFLVNWFEGTAADQSYMTYYENAIWESVAYGVGVSSNNYIFRYDLINGGWGLYGFGAGGMLIQNNHLFFGGVTDGSVYQFGSGASDNGTAILAYWRSKLFTGADPFLQNSLTNIDVFAKKDTGSTLTSTYTMDTTRATSYSVALSSSGTVVESRKLLPSGNLGYSWDIKLGDTSTSSQWELLGVRMGYTVNPYRPTSP